MMVETRAASCAYRGAPSCLPMLPHDLDRPDSGWKVQPGDAVFKTVHKTQRTKKVIVLRHHGEENLSPYSQKKKNPGVPRCWSSVTVHEQTWVNGKIVGETDLGMYPKEGKPGYWRLRVKIDGKGEYVHKMIAFCWPGEGKEPGPGSFWSAAMLEFCTLILSSQGVLKSLAQSFEAANAMSLELVHTCSLRSDRSRLLLGNVLQKVSGRPPHAQ